MKNLEFKMRNDDKEQKRLLTAIQPECGEQRTSRTFSSWGKRVGAQCNFIHPIKAFRTSTGGSPNEKNLSFGLPSLSY